MNMFEGIKVWVSDAAAETVPIFPDKPATKRRLRRTRGKFGRTHREVPTTYRVAFGLIVHPTIYRELKKRTQEQNQ